MKKVLALVIVAASTAACGNTSKFVVGGKELFLADNSGMCQIVIPSDQVTLDLIIPWPCQVHKDTSDKIRVYKQSGDVYFLIESSVPHPDLPEDCLTQLQSIRASDGKFSQSNFKDTVASCPPFQWDTVLFTGLFSDR